MRIIKEGNLPEFIHTCKKCGCVFAWDDRDVKGYTVKNKWVDCPYCDTMQNVDDDEPVEHGVCFVEVER